MRFTGTESYVATPDLTAAVNAAIVLERPLLVSESFAALVQTPLQSLGRFALRGFSAPVGVYGIAS